MKGMRTEEGRKGMRRGRNEGGMERGQGGDKRKEEEQRIKTRME